MKFQVFLIGLVVALTAGAIMVAQSVPTGPTAAASVSQLKLQIPPVSGHEQAAESPATAPDLAPAKIVQEFVQISQIPPEAAPAASAVAGQSQRPQVTSNARHKAAKGQRGQDRAHRADDGDGEADD